MVGHVVWDWNGTLWDDLPQVYQAVNDALQEVNGPHLTLSEYVALFARPLPVFYRRVLGRDVTSTEWDLIANRFEVSYHRELPQASLACETVPALETVARSGATQSILSLYPHDALVDLVRDLGIGHYFTLVDGRVDDPGRSKIGTFVGHVRAAAPGIPPHRVVLIGDTIDDVNAAQVGGGTGLMVNHQGYFPPDPTFEPVFAGGLLDALRMAGFETVSQWES